MLSYIRNLPAQYTEQDLPLRDVSKAQDFRALLWRVCHDGSQPDMRECIFQFFSMHSPPSHVVFLLQTQSHAPKVAEKPITVACAPGPRFIISESFCALCACLQHHMQSSELLTVGCQLSPPRVAFDSSPQGHRPQSDALHHFHTFFHRYSIRKCLHIHRRTCSFLAQHLARE